MRRVDRPDGRGPGNGQYALQKALRERNLDWLRIGGHLRGHEIPWIWRWTDRSIATAYASSNRPFVAGPNVLFDNSRTPGAGREERAILDARSCQLLFTESEWYHRLINRHRGPENVAPIVVWPYPIDPQPDGPIDPAEYDVLVYVKSGRFSGLVAEVQRRYARSRIVRYGHYRRRRLIDVARRSRCCLYLSDDDRGPLALAEILLCGCPAVGLPTGAPFIQPGRTGVVLDEAGTSRWVEAIEACLGLHRKDVADLAAEQFDTGRIIDVIVEALCPLARPTPSP